MNYLSLIASGLILWGLNSCGHAADSPAAATAASHTMDKQPVSLHPDRAAILRDFNSWYAYHYRQIHLARHFEGLDTAAQPLERHAFLTRLATGRYVAFQTLTQSGVPYYQLHALTSPNPDIVRTIQQSANTELRHEQMEGKPLPAYAFTDLDGRRYTPETTRGKLLVIKCWFIGCFACVQEFPQLNRLVARYPNRPDVLFVSLAFDQPQALTDFLKKHAFQYAVVPQQRPYMEQQLGVDTYPTHILVDRTGRVAKVTNTIEDLEPTMAELAAATPR
ncbi:TlpA family protein disulfide reductase [Hymenobacter jeollabukensis]|uniref:TlpA family protein disulfide reductase n=1 Tax=Hymenobacter jeollabukensis TaxID=2025313 RepID=A0A5R8WSQ0_9BACT|nr:TlpA disulfide reductase family protein [Hymenobacter jeollabukensis]TLM94192.1 TlpA family protein disulfide reductase [Hymenobacter jeollabukensis]